MSWTHTSTIMFYFKKGVVVHREVPVEDEAILANENCFAKIRNYISDDELTRAYELSVFGVAVMRGSRFNEEGDYFGKPNAYYHNHRWHYADIGDYVIVKFCLTREFDLKQLVLKIFGLADSENPKAEIKIKNPRL